MIESSYEMSLWAPIVFLFFPFQITWKVQMMHPFQTRSWDQTFQGWVVNKENFQEKMFCFCFFKRTELESLASIIFQCPLDFQFWPHPARHSFFDAVVTFNDAIERKTNQTIPQSGEVKSLLQHTSPGIFWNRLRYNKCACFIIDLSSGANKQGCDYSLYAYKVFLCLRVW